tara:strand:- start:3202 stop:3987 length:786 start_codon:yes stop_codon:yes gene_type:complete
MFLKKKILKSYKKIIFKFKKKINLDALKIDIRSLNELFNHFGTDKGSSVINPYVKNINKLDKDVLGHGYAEFYENHFSNLKNKEINLLEIGTWKGASIASFYHYFKKAKIFCIDRNFKFQFRSKRVNFFYCNTTINYDIQKFNEFLIDKEINLLDIIIDDGSHIYSDILNNFKNFFIKVKPGGYYVIEDYNHYKYYKHLDDSDFDEIMIDDILNHFKLNKNFSSNFLCKDFQNYCLDNIKEISIYKGIQHDSNIVFIKKND